jgi:hypothetical protein
MFNASRPHVGVIAATVFLAALLMAGCSSDKEEGWSPFVTKTGTGVAGLDTPSQILSNENVQRAVSAAEEVGVNLTPEKGLDPPNIEGTYSLNGMVMVPDYSEEWYELAPATWMWKNQDANLHVDTEYDEGFQTGAGGGEIIRGEGSSFTVYSVLDIDDEEYGGCKERAILILDGRQLSNGDVEAVYVFTPAADPVCHALTIGDIYLERTGSAAAGTSGGTATLLQVIRNVIQQSREHDQVPDAKPVR